MKLRPSDARLARLPCLARYNAISPTVARHSQCHGPCSRHTPCAVALAPRTRRRRGWGRLFRKDRSHVRTARPSTLRSPEPALPRLCPPAANDPGRSAPGKPHRVSGSSPETGGQAAITDYLANITIQKLLFLQYENKTQEIHFYINCPGGSVSATLAIYDTMQFLECPIATYCMGIAASGAAIILAAGSKGKRYALPNSKVMIHQPWGQVGGQVSDIEIQATEIDEGPATPQRDPCQAHRPARRPDRQGNRPRPLLRRGRGQGVRPGGRRDPEDSRRKEEMTSFGQDGALHPGLPSGWFADDGLPNQKNQEIPHTLPSRLPMLT